MTRDELRAHGYFTRWTKIGGRRGHKVRVYWHGQYVAEVRSRSERTAREMAYQQATAHWVAERLS